MHETNIIIPQDLAQRLKAWRPRINISGECARALRKRIAELEAMASDELPRGESPRRGIEMDSIRITYPEALAERLRPFRKNINVSALCTAALEEYVASLEALPEHIRATLKE